MCKWKRVINLNIKCYALVQGASRNCNLFAQISELVENEFQIWISTDRMNLIGNAILFIFNTLDVDPTICRWLNTLLKYFSIICFIVVAVDFFLFALAFRYFIFIFIHFYLRTLSYISLGSTFCSVSFHFIYNFYTVETSICESWIWSKRATSKRTNEQRGSDSTQHRAEQIYSVLV